MTSRLAANIFGMLAALCLTLGANFAHAIPALQVYVEGAVYDSVNETWVLDTTTTSGVVTITATNQNGGSKVSTLSGVTMVVSALEDAAFTATLTGGDSSLNLTASSNPGDIPLLTGGDANNAASHITFSLGSFNGTSDSTIDYVSGDGNGLGNLQTFTLTLFDLTGTVIIDAYGYNNKGKLIFAPYSHNGAITTVSDVPELSATGTMPAAALLFGSLMLFRPRRRRATA